MKISRWERLALWAAAVVLCFGGGWLARDLWGGGPMEVRVQVQGADEAGSGVELVDINTADLEQLMTLPGIGEVRGSSILAEREANGPFDTPEDLLRVDGIGQGVLEGLRDYITTGEDRQ